MTGDTEDPHVELIIRVEPWEGTKSQSHASSVRYPKSQKLSPGALRLSLSFYSNIYIIQQLQSCPNSVQKQKYTK